MAGAAGTLALLDSDAAPGPARVMSSARHPAFDRLPSRIAFGSCADQNKQQPIWDAVLAADPELFIFLGDNIYGDTRDPAVLRAKYAQLAAQPGFRRLCQRTPVLAVWDDHDFGEDDAGGDFPMKEISRQIFCDFWNERADSPRRSRDGIYDAVVFAAGGRRLQVIIPDTRFNRTPLRRRQMGDMPYSTWAKLFENDPSGVPGRYERNPDLAASLLGQAQWHWLEQQLAQPADVRVLASSVQVVADFPGWEGWSTFAADQQRLLQAIRRHRANGLFCISGDMHYAEVSRMNLNTPYPLWDFTSSGLTEVWATPTPNALRVGSVLSEPNFGLLTLDWQAAGGPTVRFEARDQQGRGRIEQNLRISGLTVGP
jgi:alkaline phosphatase D